MPITDLTGTKWLLNEDGFVVAWDTSEYGWGFPFTITFVSNETTYSRLFPYLSLPTDTFDIQYDSTRVWEADYNDDDELVGAWIDQAYRTIEITGGTDATNTDLINWLQDNATQIIEPQPTDTNKISIGSLKLAKAFVGNTEIASMWLGNTKIYEKGSSYDYSYDNETLTIENAPYNYSDGVLTIE